MLPRSSPASSRTARAACQRLQWWGGQRGMSGACPGERLGSPQSPCALGASYVAVLSLTLTGALPGRGAAAPRLQTPGAAFRAGGRFLVRCRCGFESQLCHPDQVLPPSPGSAMSPRKRGPRRVVCGGGGARSRVWDGAGAQRLGASPTPAARGRACESCLPFVPLTEGCPHVSSGASVSTGVDL